MDNERIHYLDSMRAVLMLLGVIIHSAQIFSPMHVLPVVNTHTHPIMVHIVEVIHLFRMPAFFVVSGFFCCMTLERYGFEKFLKVRLSRVALPLVTTLLTLNAIQFVFLRQNGWLDSTLTDYIINGRYIKHLWFLVDLIYFFVITACAHFLLAKKISKINITPALPVLSGWWIIFIMPLFILGIMMLGKIGIPIYFNKYGIFSPYSLMYNYTFFAFGYYLYKNKALLSSILNINPIIYLVIIMVYWQVKEIPTKNIMLVVLNEYSLVLAQWAAIAICFKFFQCFFSRPSHFSRELSESSYTVYLFHYLLLMITANYLVKLEMGPFTGFIVITLTVAGMAYGTHRFIISKVPIFKKLYNGK